MYCSFSEALDIDTAVSVERGDKGGGMVICREGRQGRWYCEVGRVSSALKNV